MQAKNTAMPTYVVRFPKTLVITAAGFLFIPAVGLRMAVGGRGHWTYWHVGLFAAIGIWFLLYVSLYRTVFSADTVERRAFPGFVSSFRYLDIERIQLCRSGRGVVLVLSSNDGRQMKVQGAEDQLTQVQEALFDRFPHAFEA
jgi:hypothetical protein